MQAISNRIPLTHGIEAARQLADGASLGASRPARHELLVGVAYGLVGYGLLRFFEWQSRSHADPGDRMRRPCACSGPAGAST